MTQLLPLSSSSAQSTNHKPRLSQRRSCDGGYPRKKQAESKRLPLSSDALRQAILRAHHQAIIWNHDTVAQPVIPPPGNYGWKQEDDGWTPVMTTQLSAPEFVLHLVKYGCKKQC